MDLDGDGTQDVLTGSWPGELYIFKGTKTETGCAYAEAVRIEDKDGHPINTGNASVVYASDWDRDGDLDLVVGSIEGWVWFVPNESGDKTLKFGKAEKVKAGGKEIHEHHSGPAIADWDGNGTLDLVMGNGEGHVLWYANTARAGVPELGEAQVLHKYEGKALSDGSHCGKRVKIAVVDWNGDGRLDILAGDFGMTKPKPKVLTDEQKETLAKLEKERMELSQKMMPLYNELTKKTFEAMGLDAPDMDDRAAMRSFFEGLTDEQRKAYSKAMQQAVKESEAIQTNQKRMRELSKELAPLQNRGKPCGHVWVMLRKAPAAPATGPGSD